MKIILGAIVTNMAGSAGGQQVRRYRGGHILQNKPQYTANDKVYLNQRIALSSFLFRSWRGLDDTVRQQWNDAAPLYTFPDKFGQPTTLSGRQLFVKLNFNSRFIGGGSIDPTIINSIVLPVTTEGGTWDAGGTTYDITVNSPEGSTALSINAARLINLNDQISIRRATQILATETDGTDTFNLKPYIIAQFGTVNEGDNFLIVVVPYNEYGFRGAPQAVRFKVV